MGGCICRFPCGLQFLQFITQLFKIPLLSFVLTNSGEIVETRMEMLRDRIRTIGISVLGGKSGIEGSYELGIDSIRAVNLEDVTKRPGTYVNS